MFQHRSVDFRTISVPFACAHSNVLCVAFVTSRSWMGLWRHCWRRQWLGRVHCIDWEWDLCLECPLRFTSYFVLFSWLFYIPCYKRDKEWLPVHCGDQRHLGLCLGYVPALAYCSCRVSDQGTTLRASDLHNARATILNPGLGRVPDWRIRVQVRVLVICVSTSSPSTWLLHEYKSEYEYWLMSTSTSTSTGLWSTFFIACIGSRFLLFGLW